MNLLLGLNYSWSVVKKALVTDWHWTHVEASLPYTAYTALFALSSVIGGKMQDKYGPRLVASVGGILLGGGVMTCSVAADPLAMMASYGLAGAGAGICLATSIPTCLKCCPPDKRGLVTGVVMGGSGLAPAYFSPLADWLLGNYGIPTAFLLIGAGILTGMLLMAQFLKVPAAAVRQADASPAVVTVQADLAWRDMLRLPVFYKLWLAYFFMSSGGLMIIGHIATIATTQANWDNGFYLVMLLAVFNTGGRITGGFLSDRFGRVPTLRAVFLIVSVNLLLFACYTTPLLLAFGAALTGICYGAGASLIALITAEYFGLKNLGANYGIILTSWGLAGVLGPLVGGRAVDVTGQYVIAYLISAVLLFTSFLLVSKIKPPALERPADQ
ncbi:MAG TPA: OFA family MFS transporter [Negativicutes bacterium]|nr:OFA family MFS transporter [Negativicutes bacterium]